MVEPSIPSTRELLDRLGQSLVDLENASIIAARPHAEKAMWLAMEVLQDLNYRLKKLEEKANES